MYGVKLYYIVSLHQTTTISMIMFQILRCIISFLYIKPQLVTDSNENVLSCIISFLYIKPQPLYVLITSCVCCIISFLYIKPQLWRYQSVLHKVVLYRFSTSNHNARHWRKSRRRLYYIVSLHQTTTGCLLGLLLSCCIISFLYIKPQQIRNVSVFSRVVFITIEQPKLIRNIRV